MPKKLIGIVTSDVQDKTIVVTQTSRETHPLYGKKYTKNRKYAAHDEKNKANKGDQVEISQCRPVSKRKVWQLDRIITTGHAEVELAEDAALSEAIGSTEAEKETV